VLAGPGSPVLDRVLVGTDGSELADRATRAALGLAEACQARVRFLHAIEQLSMLGPAPEMEPRLARAREDAGRAILAENHRWADEQGVEADEVLRDGSAGALLMAEAREWGADLVAVGSRGRSGLERAVLGSVADALVRKSPVPVLTVRETPEPSLGAIDRILIPSDGSALAASAAPLAIELARRTGAGLDLLHAREDDAVDGDEALEPIAERCRTAEVPYEAFTVDERPHRALVGHAEDRGIDLVVMATHGRGGLERFLVGSITDKVVRTLGPPLVSVRPDD
jgi:nucleotide-binding universal stress UspA family protein